MTKLNTYLTFDGNCADAMRFYERVLNGKLEMMTHGNSPMAAQATPANANRIMHARLAFDGGVLMASDSMAGQPYEGMHGFSIALMAPTAADAKRVYDALSDGGKIIMPLQKTFWSEAFGMLVDRFGAPWMVNVMDPNQPG
jgi:PhnB protein